MTEPDRIIAGLKRVIDEQHNVNVDLRERLQTAQADVERWQAEALAFEAESKSQAHYRQMCLHIPWAIFDQVVRALENGDAKHALKLLNREAHS